jgi:hypothetical protein
MWRPYQGVPYNSAMRLVGRILVVLGVASAPTVVAVIGCNVDVPSLPPLPNELPNSPGTPVNGTGGSSTTTSTSKSTTTGTTTSSGTSSSDGGGTFTATTECDCVSADLAGNAACVACQNASCLTQYNTCMAGNCGAAIACANGCSNNGTCIAGCLDIYPDYAALMSCLFQDCTSSCGVAVPISDCPVSDGGPGSDAGPG